MRHARARYFNVAAGAHVPGLVEDDGFVLVEEDSVFNVPTNCAREHHFFKVSTFFHQIFNGIAMGDTRDALFDDGPVIENFGDIVRSGPNEFYTTIVGLVMRFAADEGRQE